MVCCCWCIAPVIITQPKEHNVIIPARLPDLFGTTTRSPDRSASALRLCYTTNGSTAEWVPMFCRQFPSAHEKNALRFFLWHSPRVSSSVCRSICWPLIVIGDILGAILRLKNRTGFWWFTCQPMSGPPIVNDSQCSGVELSNGWIADTTNYYGDVIDSTINCSSGQYGNGQQLYDFLLVCKLSNFGQEEFFLYVYTLYRYFSYCYLVCLISQEFWCRLH